ncbi:hypothetical protein [Caulobacter sp. FWC2]|uniref:hypothetical protein n=1 Tax=Caulobacter sp. FWC2 TaxID=69664 RepID=UPI000C155D9E|nr:hypothetical protein [Caulobacter sp. FWC2]PIB91290.1 hypothetical protein CSW62_06695 [Caulobacter sp. FWC2]
MAATFKFPALELSRAIVQRDGTPTPGFQIFWQNLGKAIETQEGAQDDLLTMLQAAIADIAALQTSQSDQIDYLNAFAEWMTDFVNATTSRTAYLQICVAVLATATSTTLPPPDPPLPDYPGPAPTPPTP